MPEHNPIVRNSFLAGEDLTGKAYHIVTLAAADSTQVNPWRVALCDASDVPTGVLLPAPGEENQQAVTACLAHHSMIAVIVGAAGVTAGWVGSDASGQLVVKTTGQNAIGRVARTYASGSYAPVLIDARIVP